MTTLSDLVADIESYLYGFGIERDKETALSAAVSDTVSTTLTVVDGAQIDRGLLEIGDELMAVRSSDRNTGTITLQPWGRGAQGTTAAIHSAGARVVNNPRFPRSRIKATINQVINQLYPDLWAVATDMTNTSRPATVTYPVNASAQSIVSISVKTLGPSQMWQPITRYRFDSLAATSYFSTGRSVDIYEGMAPGQPIKIIYRKPFSQFSGLDSQTFADVGLDENYRDILALGVEARLLPALDGARLQLGAIESTARAPYTQPGAATQIARDLRATFQSRIAEERGRLLRLYPGSQVRSN